MKKRIFAFVLAMCLSLAACGSVPSQPESSTPETETLIPTTENEIVQPMPGYDAQNRYLLTDIISFQETDTFFCGSNCIGNYLHYYDKQSGISGVVCANPICTHDSSDCGAYIQSGANLSVYDGKLYWIARETQDGKEFYLWQSDLSGMNRKKVKPLAYEGLIMQYQPQRYVIHRGMLYMLGEVSTVVGAEIGVRITLLSTTLDDSENINVLHDESFTSAVSASMNFAGDNIYFSTITFVDGKTTSATITKYHIKDGTRKEIFKTTDITANLESVWVTEDGQLYLSGGDEDGGYVWKLADGMLEKGLSFPNNVSIKLLDGIVIGIGRENDTRTIEIKNYSDETIYTGKLFPNGIPALDDVPDKCSIAVVGGDADKIILNLQNFVENGMVDYTVMLDLHDNLKPTILWSSAK